MLIYLKLVLEFFITKLFNICYMMMCHHIFRYFSFLAKAFKYNVKLSIFFSQLFNDFYTIGSKSVFLMSLLAFSIGFVTALQLITMLEGVFIPDFLIIVGIKNTIFLEFAPTILCFIFLGRNVTAMACNIFDKKRSGYYDNFSVIGVNTVSFSCLSKIIACTLCFPLLTVFSCLFSLIGSYIYCVFISGMSSSVFFGALITYLNQGFLCFCFFKTIVFGFLCSSIAAYLGYCYYEENSVDIIYVSQHCFTVLSIVLLLADIFLNLFKSFFLIIKY